MDVQDVFNVRFGFDEEGIFIAWCFSKREDFSVALTQQSVIHFFVTIIIKLLSLSSDHQDFRHRCRIFFAFHNFCWFFTFFKVKFDFCFMVEESFGGNMLDLNWGVCPNPIVDVYTCAHKSELWVFLNGFPLSLFWTFYRYSRLVRPYNGWKFDV